jgi:crossover junction endodeoxyribonuclease RuvC
MILKKNEINGVIGIDPGSRQTGYGIVLHSNSGLVCFDYGCIHLNPSDSIADRLVDFADQLSKIIKLSQVHVMAIESLFTAKNVQSILKLGQIRGVAILLGAQQGLSIEEYSPASVKQALVGYGRASKEQMQFMVQKILRLQKAPTPLDASDALAIAICHMSQSRLKERLRKYL